MSDALFLPRELFQPAQTPAAMPAPHAEPTAQATRRSNGTASFASGADVAADLLRAMQSPPAPAERRRKPRSANPLKLDL